MTGASRASLVSRVLHLVASASPLRTAVETVLVIVGLSLVARVLVPASMPSSVIRQALDLFVAPFAALWAALRLRSERPARAALDIFIAVLPLLALDAVRAALFPRGVRHPIYLLISVCGFLVLRAVVLAGYTLALRARTRLAYRLLIGQLGALGLLVGLAALVPAILAVQRLLPALMPKNASLHETFAMRFVVGVLPQLVIVGFWVVAALVVLLPPFAVLSRAVARPVTRRLEALTSHVETLGTGRLDARLEDPSSDEVGRLTSEVNAMAGRLQAANDALTREKGLTEALLASRRELLASISHELRTPVAALSARAESLPATPEREALLADAARLGRTLEDLFDLARLEAGKLAIESVTFDGHEVVSRVVTSLAPLAHRTARIEIVVASPAAGEPILLRGDPHRTFQILSNLVHNAIRHGLPGGLVAVSLERGPDRMARLVVADTGPGIPESEAAEVFERFRRGRAAGAGGAGLGLALVKELAEAMGGSVSLASRMGEGSEGTAVTVVLPLA